MFVTDLPAVLRGAGLEVVEVAGWETRTTNSAGMTEVRGLMMHHTAGSASGNIPSLGTVKNGRPDVPGPLIQVLLGRDGVCYVVAAGRCNHPGKGSGYGVPTNDAARFFLGIEIESTGRGDFTEAQLKNTPIAAAAIARAYKFGASMVVDHKEWAKPVGRKIDVFGWPGDAAGFRSQVAALLGGAAAQPAPTPVLDAAAALRARVHTLISPADRRYAQDGLKRLGYYAGVVDGSWGPLSQDAGRRFQRDEGIEQDAIPGPITRAHIAARLAAGAVVPLELDGSEGPLTIKAEQRRLKALGHYSGAIDGVRGPLTVKAEQAYLRQLGYYTGKIDGDFARLSTIAEQQYLTKLGYYTGHIDGSRGAQTKVALQRALNDGRF